MSRVAIDLKVARTSIPMTTRAVHLEPSRKQYRGINGASSFVNVVEAYVCMENAKKRDRLTCKEIVVCICAEFPIWHGSMEY
jgi:hypothetical protein